MSRSLRVPFGRSPDYGCPHTVANSLGAPQQSASAVAPVVAAAAAAAAAVVAAADAAAADAAAAAAAAQHGYAVNSLEPEGMRCKLNTAIEFGNIMQLKQHWATSPTWLTVNVEMTIMSARCERKQQENGCEAS